MKGSIVRRRRSGGFSALSVTGGLYPPEFVNLIAEQKAKRQSGTDYGLTKSLALKDEIARYWRIANDLYADRIAHGDVWLVALLRDVFGYADIAPAQPEQIGERTYPITHTTLGGAVRVVLTDSKASLDRADTRFGEGRGRAPHGLLQDALNADPTRPWGIVANGESLRLVRENPSLTRPAYVQADLARMFDEQLYSDFAALWLTIHASRPAPTADKASNCILEAWRAEAAETGERALEHLRDGVTEALRCLGNGFLREGTNDHLRAQIRQGTFSADTYFQELLRLVYRLLFLFVVEDRGLLHDPAATNEQRKIYRDGYSLVRLRERASRRRHYDRYPDLWDGLQILFSSLRNGAEPIGIPALGGLFAREQCPALDRSIIANDNLLEAIRALAYFRSGDALVRVNYRDMGTEEFGSVYESLLEYHPYINIEASPWIFGLLGQGGEKTTGAARKLSGSYYTPAPLVNELIKSALEPVMAQTIAARPSDPRLALLELKVVDPASGSGHFLLAAARRIASEIARLEAGADTPDEMVRQHALREVVQHCIYGVDRNPLAVELCRTALWMEAVEPGKPLTFLDPHVRPGDSLVGILDPSILANGIPDEAYDPLAGDEKSICRSLKKRNREAEDTVQGNLFDQESLKDVAGAEASFDSMPEETLAQIEAKRQAWGKERENADVRREELRANLFVGAFFAPKISQNQDRVPLTEDLNRLQGNMAMRPDVVKYTAALAKHHRFFHWHVEFADIMQRGGFDLILGNPPWERIKLQEKEFFEQRSPSIAAAPNKAARERMISALARSDAPADRALYIEFQETKREAEAFGQFARGSGRYPKSAAGDINLYALFAEMYRKIVRHSGAVGVLVPSGLATDSTTANLYREIITSGALVSFFEFENEGFFSVGQGHMVRFALFTLKPDNQAVTDFLFQGKAIADLQNPVRHVRLSSKEIELLNPNTLTSPIFQTAVDASIAISVYQRTPVLMLEGIPSGNPWNIQFLRMFDMSNDSGVFRTARELVDAGGERRGVEWILDGERYLRLFEAKMIYLYNHRHGDFADCGDARPHQLPRASPDLLEQGDYLSSPHYWVPEQLVAEVLKNKKWHRKWLLGWRDVTDARASERTVVAAAVPLSGYGNKFVMLLPHVEAARIPALIGNLSCIPFDFIARQKLGGITLNYFIMKQLPVLPPGAYSADDLGYIVPRVLELVYTAQDMQGFAKDLGHEAPPFRWDEGRRAWLRAELDAYYARLYGLTRDELRYILDPASVYGINYPSETFRVLRDREIRQLGEYRSARLILEAWDRLEQGEMARLVSRV